MSKVQFSFTPHTYEVDREELLELISSDNPLLEPAKPNTTPQEEWDTGDESEEEDDEYEDGENTLPDGPLEADQGDFSDDDEYEYVEDGDQFNQDVLSKASGIQFNQCTFDIHIHM